MNNSCIKPILNICYYNLYLAIILVYIICIMHKYVVYSIYSHITTPLSITTMFSTGFAMPSITTPS